MNADVSAEPFEAWLADVTPKMGPHVPEQCHPFEPEHLVEVANVLYRVRANWKIVVENFIDGYHLPLLHPVSLAEGDFSRQKWEPAGRHISFYRPLKDHISHDNQALPVVEGIPPTFGAAYYWLFPNVAIYETATTWSTFHVIPVSSGVSLVNSRMRAMPSALERLGAGSAEIKDPPHIVSAKGPFAERRVDLRGVHPLKSNSVMLEDIYACEAVQSGLQSPRAGVGLLSRWESTLTFFQQHVLDACEAAQ